MQFMKCPQTTIFSGRACCGRLLDYHIARHGGRYSSFLDRFPNTHTHTEGGRGGRVGADWAAAPSPQGGSAAARERAEGRAGAGGREIERLISTAGGRERERAHTAAPSKERRPSGGTGTTTWATTLPLLAGPAMEEGSPEYASPDSTPVRHKRSFICFIPWESRAREQRCFGYFSFSNPTLHVCGPVCASTCLHVCVCVCVCVCRRKKQKTTDY